ncbi:hypothetical protein O159_11170 [Leifsonia xyli subsp. cynodontis DSM 46306]|uniref:DUF3159 domain-containing protein n=1 Tax=Leifsonia xyli subsp. cynodontis DSM 46306 TaxID=1389489 RepID=U3P8E8_LEIXC|nr:DUF3159 domain-containing protein [Leifsonia xyli]AGW41212.1 hypothetical protein O159_11170 [Leifsonia xyli subsp. cynodontis DSM 46306]
MTEHQDAQPEKDADTPEAADPAVVSLGESLARAARKSGLGELADAQTPTGTALLAALGGVRGLLETVLPGLVFLVLFTFTASVPLSIGFSVAVAVAFTIVRIAGKTPVTQAMAGLIGVGVSAVLALITGRGEDNFILGIWTNAAYAAALLISIVVRWPLIGLAAGYLMGDGLAWRSVKSRFRVMQALTFLWFLLFAARLLVQVPLYLAHTDAATSALGLAKLLMGVPLYAPLLLVTWFVVKGQFPREAARPA